jgi:type IV pilus assembly protein PilF
MTETAMVAGALWRRAPAQGALSALCLALIWLAFALFLAGCVGVGGIDGSAESASGLGEGGYGIDAGGGDDADVLVGERRDARSRAVAHVELAGAYYSQGNMGVALEEVRIALKADPGYAPGHNMLGLIQVELKDGARARASFERALRIDPRDPDTNHNFGRLLCQNGQVNEGVRRFMVAVQNPLYRTPARSYASAASCYLGAQRTDEALELFQQSLRIDPNFVPALLPTSELLMRKGNLEAARALATRFDTLVRPTAESIWLQLRIDRRRGDTAAESTGAALLRQRFPDSAQARRLAQGEFD